MLGQIPGEKYNHASECPLEGHRRAQGRDRRDADAAEARRRGPREAEQAITIAITITMRYNFFSLFVHVCLLSFIIITAICNYIQL